MDDSILANVLHGNSRLKSLTPLIPINLEVGNRELLAVAGGGDLSTTSISTIDGDATPTIGEKRKARP